MTQDRDYYADHGRDALGDTTSAWVLWSDERYGTELALVVAGEVGDPAGESNVAAAEHILAAYLGGDAEQYTVGRSGRTWLRGVAVRVFGEDGEVTEAWRVAVDEVIIPLENYPLLDEDDFYDREHEVIFENLVLDYGAAADIVAEALNEYGDIRDYRHDDVAECVEALLKDRPDRRLTEDEADGLRFFVRQRVGDLDIPTLAAQTLSEEVRA